MERVKRELNAEDMERIQLPELYWTASVDKIGLADPGKEVFLRYLRQINDVVGKGYGLLLWGDNGVGKTGCAAIIAKEACRYGWSSMFIRVADLLAWETRKAMFDEEARVTIWERARGVELLVLDDLGKEVHDANGRSMKEIEEFLRDRISRKKSTIITTNLSPRGQMEELYKPSMMHVMKESIYAIRCTGVDHREDKQAEVAAALSEGVGSGWGE
jgi:DNA replication protein DnaC